MTVDVNYIDLEHIDDVTDIDPAPTVAVSATEHHFNGLGDTGSRLLLELLERTDDSEPFGERVFGRLGLGYQHTSWRDYDLYWLEGDEDEMVAALKEWNASQNM